MTTRVFSLLLVFTVGACRSSAAPMTEPIAVPTVAGTAHAADPSLTIDPGNQDLLLAWVAGDSAGYHMYFARSNDAGANWTAPVRITSQTGEIKPHAEASPRMVAASGVIAVFWPQSIEVPGRRFPASHLRFSRSTDGGLTWSSGLTLNDDTTRTPAGHTFHGATSVGDSTFLVAWLDSRTGAEPHVHGDTAVHHDGDATIYTAVSRDLGSTWDRANTRHWGDACPCCRVSLVARQDGTVLAGWRGHFDGSVRDPVIATLAPTPASPQRVSVDGWVFQGCPHTGPALATDANGGVHVAWFTGKAGAAGVFYSHSSSGTDFVKPIPLLTGEALPAAHPAVVSIQDGALVAINLDQQGARALTLARIGRNDAVDRYVVPNSQGADHPQLVALGNRAVLAWTQKDGANSGIRLVIVGK